MDANLRSWAASSALLFVLGAAAAGCGEEKKVPAVEQDAGAADPAQKQAALNSKLAAAVKAAESAQAPGKTQDGPPEKGIFAPGGAHKVVAPGAAPKVEMLGEGADPKVALELAPSDDEQKQAVSVAVRLGGGQTGTVSVEYGLAYKLDKPKDKPKDDKKDAAVREPLKVVGKIAQVVPSPGLPPDAAEQIGKLKGTELKWTVSAERGATDVSYTLAKGADAGLSALVSPLVEAIGLVTPPLPSKPVGVGAYWMVTDRITSSIIDVVRYRVFRVEKIEKGQATLSMDIRQYAVKSELDVGGGQKVPIELFDSQGKGRSEWTARGLLPAHSDAQVRMGASARVQGKQAMLQTDFQAKLNEVAAEKTEKKK